MDNKLLVIIVAALVVVSIGLSAVSLITIMGVKSQMTASTEAATTPGEGEPVVLPLSQIDLFNFTDTFIFTFQSTTEPGRVDNVVCSLALGLDNEHDDLATVLEELTSKEKIVRSELEKVLKTKQVEDFTDPTRLTTLEDEVLMGVRAMLETDVVVDSYFTNVLTSSK